MELHALIVEQLEEDGTLRSFKMDRSSGQFDLIVSFADEYDEPRDGPFHFYDEKAARRFSKGFAQCRKRKIDARHFFQKENRYHVNLDWAGIRTVPDTLSYYALSLPKNAIPINLSVKDQRPGSAEYPRTVSRDDQRQRYVVYLECSSPRGQFDFDLSCDFEIDAERFGTSEYQDAYSKQEGRPIHDYRFFLPPTELEKVEQHFDGVGRPVAAIGPGAVTEGRLPNHASQLYEEVKSLASKKTLNLDEARLLIEKADDAVKEFGNSNQEKKVELRKWRDEAASRLPPTTFKEVADRGAQEWLNKLWPQNATLRKSLLAVVFVGLVVAGVIAFKRTLLGEPNASSGPTLDSSNASDNRTSKSPPGTTTPVSQEGIAKPNASQNSGLSAGAPAVPADIEGCFKNRFSAIADTREKPIEASTQEIVVVAGEVQPKDGPIAIRFFERNIPVGGIKLSLYGSSHNAVFKDIALYDDKCEEIDTYSNKTRGGDKHVANNFDELSLQLSGHEYILRLAYEENQGSGSLKGKGPVIVIFRKP